MRDQEHPTENFGIENQGAEKKYRETSLSLVALSNLDNEPKTPTDRTKIPPPSKLESCDTAKPDESDELEQLLHTARVSDDPITDYLRQIGKIPLLTAAMEVQLAHRIEAGLIAERILGNQSELRSSINANTDELAWLAEDGRQAKNQFIEANLRYVVSLARTRIGLGVPFLDMIQDGNKKLIHAVEKFDYKKGFKFSTYATSWIRQALDHSVADQARTIRIPFHVVEQVKKVNRAARQLRLDLNRDPTIEELVLETELGADEIARLQEYDRDVISFQQSLSEDDEGEFGDLIEDTKSVSPEKAAENTLRDGALFYALEWLDDREAKILKMRFGLDNKGAKSYTEIARLLNLKVDQVRVIEKNARENLLKALTHHNLRDYLE